MTGREIFQMWSPFGAKWVDWVRPVPFITINDNYKINNIVNFTIPSIHYISKLQDNMAIIVDLPNHVSIEEGIALAKLGFRPIPLYNGTQAQHGAMALVDNHLEHALIWGAFELQKIQLMKEASPAFLLDSNRIHRYKMNVSAFDNSWDIYEHDMPSAEYFLNHGIDIIIVIGEKIHKDVRKILYKFQKNGITILFSNGYEQPKEVTIRKPLRK